MKGSFPLLTKIEVLILKPILIPHQNYQQFLMDRLQKHYSSGILTLVNSDWPVITKLWITDLSKITTTLIPYYGRRGPAPRDPASMMRSYLLLLLTNPTMSLDGWVDELRRVPLYAIISGFEPSVGTFHDFFRRLWGSEKKNITHKKKSKKSRKRKSKKGKMVKRHLFPNLVV